MNIVLASFAEAFILAAALSVAAISLLCGIILLLSLKAGALFAPSISEGAAKAVSFAVLLILGIVRVSDSLIKKWIKNRQGRGKQLAFSAFNLKFILSIYSDPKAADMDRSNTLSVRESVALSIALSLDGIAAGVGAGITGINSWLSVVVFILLAVAAVKGGCLLGNKIAGKRKHDISWVSGVMLMILALVKLLG